MNDLNKHSLYELDILKQVEGDSQLTNRKAAGKLGVSIKLAHEVLRKMVDKGLLHVKVVNSRRWDYFLTPAGIAEKTRLTLEFFDFSMHFYREARKRSSQVCRDLAEAGHIRVAFLGAGDLAEIAYLGVQEWGLELDSVYADSGKKRFMQLPVQPLAALEVQRPTLSAAPLDTDTRAPDHERDHERDHDDLSTDHGPRTADNGQHPTFNVQRSTLNAAPLNTDTRAPDHERDDERDDDDLSTDHGPRTTSNIQHSTSNAQRPTLSAASLDTDTRAPDHERDHDDLSTSNVQLPLLVCLYDTSNPMRGRYLPDGVPASEHMHWIFEEQR